MTIFRIAAGLAALLLTTAATATDWAVDPATSTLGFTATAQGEAFDGRFSRFDAKIAFDPADLAGSTFDVAIALASVDSQNSERDDTLKTGDFFNTRAFPEATYTARSFRALGGDRYAADGTLTLRGVARPVVLTFTWTAGAPATLDGTATLDRTAFGVGGGEWEDAEAVAHEVTVTTHLRLTPAGG